VLEGEVILIDDAGETVLRAGDSAGFKAGEPNGHHLVNRSGRPAVLLEVGSRRPQTDAVDYPDLDMVIPEGPGATTTGMAGRTTTTTPDGPSCTPGGTPVRSIR
jgi:uncharacterized cupin superfamily protein